MSFTAATSPWVTGVGAWRASGVSRAQMPFWRAEVWSSSPSRGALPVV